MKKFALLLALAAAGLASAVALAAPAAHTATGLGDLGSLGYTLTVQVDAGCSYYHATGNGAPDTTLGSTDVRCTDPHVLQQNIDGLVAAYPPPPPPPPATTTATTPTDTTPTTATTPTATTPPPPPPPVTTIITATLPAPPTADFAAAAAANAYTVDFTDASTSSSSVTSRVWQFGDGAAATGPGPTHAYAGPGTYAVALIVVDSAGLASVAVHELTILANHSITLGPRTTAIAKTVTKPVVKKPATKKTPATARKHVVKKRHRRH